MSAADLLLKRNGGTIIGVDQCVGDKEIVKEPVYGVKVLDRLVTRVAREIRLLEQALKTTNAKTAARPAGDMIPTSRRRTELREAPNETFAFDDGSLRAAVARRRVGRLLTSVRRRNGVGQS